MISEFYVNGCIMISNIFLIDRISGDRIITRQSKLMERVAYGISYGFLASLSLFFTIHGPGSIIIDLRYIPIILSALFGGPLSTMVAAFLLSATRLFAFGVSEVSILGAVMALLAGIGCSWLSRSVRSIWITWLIMNLYCLSVASLILLYAAPDRWELLRRLFFMWPSYLFFGAACLFMGLRLRGSKELSRQQKEASRTDYITGSYNYFGMISQLSEYIQEASRSKTGFDLYMIECSNNRHMALSESFDTAYDSLGGIIREIKKEVPGHMFLSRLGGNIFSFAVPRDDIRHAPEEVLKNIARNLKEKQRLDAVCSYVGFPEEAVTASALLGEAERKIYELNKNKWKLEQEKLMVSERRRVLGELAAGMAHEIRNPLTTVRGFLQIAKDSGDLNRWYGLIMGEIDRMVQLTQEFLQYSKSKEQQLQVARLEELLGKCLQMTEPEIVSSGHQLKVHLRSRYPLPVLCDPDKISQVLINLIKNSVDAMKEPGEITVTLERTEEAGRILIADSGVGIPEDHLPRIFDPFFTTKAEGTGLGLAIANKIIQEHNGAIEVESKELAGTTFTVTIPLADSA